MSETPDSDMQSPFTEVPIEITVSVGQARPTVRERLIARGELQESEGDGGALLVRITDVVAPDAKA